MLISLHRGYGLGDAVQMSAVLRHVVKYRPNWKIDFQAEAGRHCIGRGMVENHFELGKNPHPEKVYDAGVEILLYDTWSNFHDRPNTRVSSCLKERFDLDWDAACGRYCVDVSPAAELKARDMLRGLWEFCGRYNGMEPRWVAIHYKGDSSPSRKDLSDDQIAVVCEHIRGLGCEPLILDYRDSWPLSRKYPTTGRRHYSREWGRDAEMQCAVIAKCVAFVGIDSGPSKCASATDTPALVVWTGHHPAPFHDPAPNTTHLVPEGYHGLEPVVNDPGVVSFFEANYIVRTYQRDPVDKIKRWLGEILK